MRFLWTGMGARKLQKRQLNQKYTYLWGSYSAQTTFQLISCLRKSTVQIKCLQITVRPMIRLVRLKIHFLLMLSLENTLHFMRGKRRTMEIVLDLCSRGKYCWYIGLHAMKLQISRAMTIGDNPHFYQFYQKYFIHVVEPTILADACIRKPITNKRRLCF